MDLTAPPLVPIAALALASSGQVGEAPPGGERAAPVRAGLHAGTTDQGRPVAIRVRRGGRAGGWRIGYVARCDDGTSVRGRYVSGAGTPPLAIDARGGFRLARSEPAEFRPEGTGSARFALTGRLGGAGGSGTWRLELVTPPAAGRRVTCTVGPLGWRVGGPRP